MFCLYRETWRVLLESLLRLAGHSFSAVLDRYIETYDSPAQPTGFDAFAIQFSCVGRTAFAALPGCTRSMSAADP
jgi:hypothetical protein